MVLFLYCSKSWMNLFRYRQAHRLNLQFVERSVAKGHTSQMQFQSKTTTKKSNSIAAAKKSNTRQCRLSARPTKQQLAKVGSSSSWCKRARRHTMPRHSNIHVLEQVYQFTSKIRISLLFSFLPYFFFLHFFFAVLFSFFDREHHGCAVHFTFLNLLSLAAKPGSFFNLHFEINEVFTWNMSGIILCRVMKIFYFNNRTMLLLQFQLMPLNWFLISSIRRPFTDVDSTWQWRSWLLA